MTIVSQAPCARDYASRNRSNTAYPATNKVSLCLVVGVTRITILRNPWKRARAQFRFTWESFPSLATNKEALCNGLNSALAVGGFFLSGPQISEIAGETAKKRSPSRAHPLIDFRRCNELWEAVLATRKL